MSVAPGEGSEPVPDIFSPQGDMAFSSLMDILVDEEKGTEGREAEGQPAAGTDGAGGKADGAAGAPAGEPAAKPGQPADVETPAEPAAGGAEGDPAGGAADDAAGAGAGDRPAGWDADAATFVPKLGELSTKFEERTSQVYQQTALAEVQEEHSNYFEAISKHPRLLVGTQVPAIGREGMETIRDTNDAREWQEAVKSILVEEVNDRAARAVEENRTFMDNVHASIDLFKNNVDLIPGTKNFDTELANEFAKLAKPYELRVDGKLQGYSIPVQPIIDSLRAGIKDRRAATPPPPASASAAPAGGGGTSKKAAASEPPQAGIPSKAGHGSDSEDFSTLFGTIGLPNLQI